MMKMRNAIAAVCLTTTTGSLVADVVTVSFDNGNEPTLSSYDTHDFSELEATLYGFETGHNMSYNLLISLTGTSDTSSKHYFSHDLGQVGSTYYTSTGITNQFRYGEGRDPYLDDPGYRDLAGEAGDMIYVLFGQGSFGTGSDDFINGYFQLENVDEQYMRIVGYAFNTDVNGGITVRNIPAPSGMMTLGVAGFFASRRRR